MRTGSTDRFIEDEIRRLPAVLTVEQASSGSAVASVFRPPRFWACSAFPPAPPRGWWTVAGRCACRAVTPTPYRGSVKVRQTAVSVISSFRNCPVAVVCAAVTRAPYAETPIVKPVLFHTTGPRKPGKFTLTRLRKSGESHARHDRGRAALGIILGPLGRLVAPGKQRIGIGWTILAGAIAALLGGLLADRLGLSDTEDNIDWLRILIQIAAAAVAVSIVAFWKGWRRTVGERLRGD
jgi:uncharacterized membrane protein YeaQ/YmgE (transglycosylase-associated protein family)